MSAAAGPWRKVKRHTWHVHYARSGAQRDTLGYYVLTLECDHVTERNCRRASAEQTAQTAPPPTRVRCEDCSMTQENRSQ